MGDNEYGKKEVDLYIGEKVGSMVEEEKEGGLGDLVEEMCLKGRKKFGGKCMVKWVECVGVKLGYKVNGYRRIDESVYGMWRVGREGMGVED